MTRDWASMVTLLVTLGGAVGCTGGQVPATTARPDSGVKDPSIVLPGPEDASVADAGTVIGPPPPPADAGTVAPPPPPPTDAGVTEPPPAVTPCGGACVAWNEVSTCTRRGGVEEWTESTCPDGQGCVGGACVPGACSDECYLGQTDCRLWNMSNERFHDPDPASRTSDRARAFEGWIRHDTESLFHDGIVSVRYTTAARSTVDTIYLGDTALHTGVYAAAEALRLTATGSVRAKKNLRGLIEAFDLWYNVSGSPGVLATIAVPAGDARIRDWTDWDCAAFDRHCNVGYAGQSWDFVGDPSRDMYMGPLLGLPLAYDALTPLDEDVRELIRRNLMVQAEELIMLRSLPVRFTINGATLPVRNMMSRFFIPDPREMEDGAIGVTIDTGDLQDSGAITGGQEFMPNPSVLFRQVNLLSNLPDIPRSSSAMMVAAMVRAAIHVTDGVPAYAQRRAALLDFYLNNSDEWGNVRSWIDYGARTDAHNDCGDRYFGYNIAYIPAFIWAYYEDDPVLRADIVTRVVGELWSQTSTHKNSFFALMTAEVTPGFTPADAAVATEQVEDFPPPPRIRRAVDLRDDPEYRNRRGDCANELDHDDAVDTGDRPAVYFAWHSDPWKLVDTGDTRQTYPGHDYLVAYWMARAFGFLGDDRPTSCLRYDR